MQGRYYFAQCLTETAASISLILTLILIADVYMIKESSSAVVDSW